MTTAATGDPREVLSTTLARLVERDEGELYLVALTEAHVKLHLRGRFSGCPGSYLASEKVIQPLLHELLPGLSVEVTWGWLLPEGAARLRPPGDSEA